MSEKATVTSKGQVTIPVALRTRLHLRAGDRLVFREDADGRLYVEKDTASFDDLKGMVKVERPVSMQDIRAWVASARVAIGSGE